MFIFLWLQKAEEVHPKVNMFAEGMVQYLNMFVIGKFNEDKEEIQTMGQGK